MFVRKSLNTNANHEVHTIRKSTFDPRVQDPIDLWRFRFVDPSRGRRDGERERERDEERM